MKFLNALYLATLLVSSSAISATTPEIDIKVNPSDNQLTMTSSDVLSINLSLDSVEILGQSAECGYMLIWLVVGYLMIYGVMPLNSRIFPIKNCP